MAAMVLGFYISIVPTEIYAVYSDKIKLYGNFTGTMYA